MLKILQHGHLTETLGLYPSYKHYCWTDSIDFPLEEASPETHRDKRRPFFSLLFWVYFTYRCVINHVKSLLVTNAHVWTLC